MEAFPWKKLSPGPIIGVDEVGRGCIAGPVYAAAVIINENEEYHLYTDSKKLSEKRRELLSKHIKANHQFSIGIASVQEISRLNILWAAMLAMKRAVEGLGMNSGHVLVDGSQKIPKLEGYKQTTLVKGDLRAHPVAAASIVAKVARDHMMVEQSKVFDQYGFEKHKGYGTPTHKEAIKKWGPCEIHRKEFAGVREFL